MSIIKYIYLSWVKSLELPAISFSPFYTFLDTIVMTFLRKENPPLTKRQINYKVGKTDLDYCSVHGH